MEKLILRYPGDPPVPIEKMSKEEFLKAYPRQPSTITTYDKNFNETNIQVIPIPAEQILCDLCNADLSHHYDGPIYVRGGTRAYCEECAKSWLKYCTPVKTI